ncbi:hypothetical protein BDM02DRAFT_3109461 [Thelephora ganbajun]|uniref:Uncharacterized protein n=1 Tax=Thelephora ganbajun TaxID=370292 RepID=A0ACB6ZS31_THEGA|nr:hypothetical protein BDM02DRAFT_3109461 [Thelephora ganbajun]
MFTDDIVAKVYMPGHELVGEVIGLGSGFLSVGGEKVASTSRPVSHSTLKVGDNVVSPFTVSCGPTNGDLVPV